MEMQKLIRRGNIHITDFEKRSVTGCYLGNGRFGSSFAALGLHDDPARQQAQPKAARSQLMHIEHWGRFVFRSEATKAMTCADYLLPLMRLYWQEEPRSVQDYQQTQDFYDGTLETAFTDDCGRRIRVTGWFDTENRDLCVVRICVDGAVDQPPYVRAAAVTDFIPYPFLYKRPETQRMETAAAEDQYRLTIRCEATSNKRFSDVFIRSTAPVECGEDGLRIRLQNGVNDLFLSFGAPVEAVSAEQSLVRTGTHWHHVWENTGWFDFPDDDAQQLWVRSMAYLLYTYDDDCGYIQPDNGFTGNMFPFHFVQDLEYIAPALMMTGHTDIVKRWVEKFAAQIEDMQRYAKRLWPDCEGIYPPWELPYGNIEDYHSPSMPVAYCYEPHNVGYLCRLAREAADFVGDREWMRTTVLPIVRECARFYRSACTRQEDGLWHLQWYPCIGQDEAGGRNKTDYLCSLYSAKYAFQSAVELRLDPHGEYAAILADGLAFDSLLSRRGTYHTCHGADDFGIQKHPVQLDGLAYFPVEKAPLEPEKAAYLVRHDITERAHEPFFYGWTLGQFLLSGSNMKDVQGWLEDWRSLFASDSMDENRIQIYETSTETEKSFYTTTHGMILQSMIRNYVNDYWDELEIAACPAFGRNVAFGGIRTRLGIRVDCDGRTAHLTSETNFRSPVNGRAVTLAKGRQRNLRL